MQPPALSSLSSAYSNSGDLHLAGDLVAPAEPIQLQSTLERFGYDNELFREMAALFREDVPACLNDLRSAVAQRRVNEAAFLAHAVGGLAATFDAVKAVQAAALVEKLALAERWSDLDAAVAALARSLDEVLAALQRTM